MIKSEQTIASKLAFFRGLVSENHRFKLALYSSMDGLDKNTKVYTPVNESQGAGYEQKTLSKPIVAESSGNANFGFSDELVWKNSTIRAAGCIIFDSDADNLAIIVASFGDTVSSTNDSFSLNLSESLIVWKPVE